MKCVEACGHIIDGDARTRKTIPATGHACFGASRLNFVFFLLGRVSKDNGALEARWKD